MRARDWLETKLTGGQKRWLGDLARRFRTVRPELIAGCDLPHQVLVGTHHKTGSAWLSSIFRDACQFHSLNYYQGEQGDLPPEFDVFMHEHSEFEFDSLPSSCRGLHIIRDPRDIIVSGCFYHQKSSEDWLHRPLDYLDGQTYQERINSYGARDDQILFEMENVGHRTISGMLAWDYSRPEFLELTYEDLIVDRDLKRFFEAFLFLGFPGSVIPSLLAITYNNSLFSGRVRKSLHVRSGASRQWEQYFSRRHKERFLDLFGDALVRLGYEDDDEWASAESNTGTRG